MLSLHPDLDSVAFPFSDDAATLLGQLRGNLYKYIVVRYTYHLEDGRHSVPARNSWNSIGPILCCGAQLEDRANRGFVSQPPAKEYLLYRSYFLTYRQ
jgi:hypothetical protein